MHEHGAKEVLGSRLAAARQVAGLSQSEAARQLGIGKAALSAWEVGRNLPDALMLGKAARVYETTADALLWGAEASHGVIVDAVRAALRAEPRTGLVKVPDVRNPPESPIIRSKALEARRRAAERARQKNQRKGGP